MNDMPIRRFHYIHYHYHTARRILLCVLALAVLTSLGAALFSAPSALVGPAAFVVR